jgi:hypothetical protein
VGEARSHAGGERVRACPRPARFLLAATLVLVVGLALMSSVGATNFMWRFVRCDRPDGSSCLNGGGGVTPPPFPVGTTFTLRIIPGAIGGCDGSGGTASRVDWGDGTAPTTGSGVADHTHTYQGAGSFVITMSCGGYVLSLDSPPLTIGGGSGGLGALNPHGPLFAPTVTALFFALIGLAAANTRPLFPGITAPPGQPAGRPAWWRPRLRPGVPASMAEHAVSLHDIPLGAIRQPQPQISMEPGKATDPFQKMHCPKCGGPMGFTVAGWFCMNPSCKLIPEGAGQTLFPTIGQPYGPPPLAPPTM